MLLRHDDPIHRLGTVAPRARIQPGASVMHDITATHAALEALARSEERYHALFDAIDDGFCIIAFFDGPHTGRTATICMWKPMPTMNGMPDGGRLTIETANRWLDQRAAADRDLPAGQPAAGKRFSATAIS